MKQFSGDRIRHLLSVLFVAFTLSFRESNRNSHLLVVGCGCGGRDGLDNFSRADPSFMYDITIQLNVRRLA